MENCFYSTSATQSQKIKFFGFLNFSAGKSEVYQEIGGFGKSAQCIFCKHDDNDAFDN